MTNEILNDELPLTPEEQKEIHQGDTTTIRHKSKDSVFVNLFEDKNNILRLYKELHPEDTEVSAEDISVQTLKTIFINDLYNDLGFIVSDHHNRDKDGNRIPKYVLLVKAQSGWNPNMALRMLLYIAENLSSQGICGIIKEIK